MGFFVIDPILHMQQDVLKMLKRRTMEQEFEIFVMSQKGDWIINFAI
jgi:hypothetical protein